MARSLRAWLALAVTVGAVIAAGLTLPSEKPSTQQPGIAGICIEGAENCEDESSGLVDSPG